MNRGIRRVGIAVIVLLLVLVGQLTYLQIIHAEDLDNDPRNTRSVLRDINRARGDIVTADGEVLATSVESDDGTDFEYQRQYPLGGLTAQVVGYQSFVVGNTGIERTYNDDARPGRDAGAEDSLGDFLRGEETTGTVVPRLRTAVQRAAAEALGRPAGQRGRPRRAQRRDRRDVLQPHLRPPAARRPRHPGGQRLLHRCCRPTRPSPTSPRVPRDLPAGLDVQDRHQRGRVRHRAPRRPTPCTPRSSALDLPLTSNQLRNFGGATCGGTVFESFVVSCNTTFAQMGLDLGDQFPPGLEGFGVEGEAPPLDVYPGRGPQHRPRGCRLRDRHPAVRVRRHRPGHRGHHARSRWRWSRRRSPTAA